MELLGVVEMRPRHHLCTNAAACRLFAWPQVALRSEATKATVELEDRVQRV